MTKIEGALKKYAWGDASFIDSLLGRESDGTPKAELWFGAHPAGPSTVAGTGRPLEAEGFPFLLKVLSIARPLSLQVHPTSEQAREGRYADRSQKAEVFCALAPSVALCGFLPLERIRENFARLGGGPVLRAADHKELFRALMADPSFLDAFDAGDLPLLRFHPGDPAAAATLFLNTVRLAPGEALFIDPGTLHCYLSGRGVELMNSSDNVLRAGMTSKRKDLDEVLRIATFEAHAPSLVETVMEGGALVYRLPPDAGFGLSRLEGSSCVLAPGGWRIVLCLEGRTRANGLELSRGEAAVAAPGERLEARADGTAFIASEA